MTYTVYLDEVVLGNWLMNFAILWVTARFGRLTAQTWRLVPAAGIGAVYALAMFFPAGYVLLSTPAKILVSLLMVACAFGPLPVRRFMTAVLIFYLASFAMGGLVFGVGWFLGGSSSYQVFPGVPDFPRRYFWPAVLVALAAAWFAGRVGAACLRRRLLQSLFQVPVVLTLYGKRVTVNGLMDTGNQLSDPLTQQPVIVVETDALAELLPDELLRLLKQDGGQDFYALVDALKDRRWATRFRLVPYRSLGNSSGLLLGFRPDKVELLHGGELVAVPEVVVALYDRKLSEDDDYRALLSPRLLDSVPGLVH